MCWCIFGWDESKVFCTNWLWMLVDASAVQSFTQFMTSTPASVHHLAPPTLVGPQPDAIAAPADDSAFAELLAAVSPEHTERLGALHRYNDVRRLLEVPIDVGGSRSLLRGSGFPYWRRCGIAKHPPFVRIASCVA